MKSALVTYSTQPRGCLPFTRPVFQSYARQHGWEYIERAPLQANPHSAHWNKILILQELLEEYDEALWLDDDVLIQDSRQEIREYIPSDASQAMVLEQMGHGCGPNTGVWYLRSCQESLNFLQEVWERGPIVGAHLNDQARVAHLLGFAYQDRSQLIKNNRIVSPSSYLPGSAFISERWNMLLNFHPYAFSYAYFLHVGGMNLISKQEMLRYSILTNRLPGWENAERGGVIDTILLRPQIEELLRRPLGKD